MGQNEQKNRVRPAVVTMLTELLDQAKQGQITSFTLVKFKPDGNVDYASEFTEISDLNRAPEHVTKLKKHVLDLAQIVAG